ncbi:MAG: isoprenylcysteine carboxylmethyltransferase family protein [Thermovirgaceae bacterium]|nr:isoprenylcysteine carboxylmethyltransferase family protein [Thermovirgaceae bacterium]
MTLPSSAYGLWTIVFINSAIFILFAASFTRLKTKLDWKSLGAFSAFIVALFAEMYGFPLTIYLLSGWLQTRFPHTDIFAHGSGHLWYTLLGLKGDPHNNPIHLIANISILAGMLLVFLAWMVLHAAQKKQSLATTGPYAWVRHPQYTGFLVIMTGFLLMWPTLLTLAMFPVLTVIYIRLARQEEAMVRKEFGDLYDQYAQITPAFIPGFGAGRHILKPRHKETM